MLPMMAPIMRSIERSGGDAPSTEVVAFALFVLMNAWLVIGGLAAEVVEEIIEILELELNGGLIEGLVAAVAAAVAGPVRTKDWNSRPC